MITKWICLPFRKIAFYWHSLFVYLVKCCWDCCWPPKFENIITITANINQLRHIKRLKDLFTMLCFRIFTSLVPCIHEKKQSWNIVKSICIYFLFCVSNVTSSCLLIQKHLDGFVRERVQFSTKRFEMEENREKRNV